MIFEIKSFEERYVLEKETSTEQFKSDCQEAAKIYFKGETYYSMWANVYDVINLLCENFGYEEIRAEEKNCCFVPDELKNPSQIKQNETYYYPDKLTESND